MIPSKKLRLIISKNQRIKLSSYYWSKEFEKKVFKIKFKDGYKILSLKKIFYDGYNIGNCLLTSYYVSTILTKPLICSGNVKLLKGTKNSSNGDHVWIESEDLIIDTTLMVTIPKEDELSKFYKGAQSITPYFTEDELSYQKDIYLKENFGVKYYYDLFNVK